MNYIEAMLNDSECLTHMEVHRELKKHGFTLSEFIQDYGWKKMYSPSEVLEWLGY